MDGRVVAAGVRCNLELQVERVSRQSRGGHSQPGNRPRRDVARGHRGAKQAGGGEDPRGVVWGIWPREGNHDDDDDDDEDDDDDDDDDEGDEGER
ncbi:hypothetical protein K0M31_010043 [Melipona bicolor]|uniref:Uncharacterized protein n=1 Tax=Melipona bicolor TaxID=60889 RepID=A0AA40FMT4_9HYME|nr:hypothetical protein K0M31_010043 [Melipona bicolor]